MSKQIITPDRSISVRIAILEDAPALYKLRLEALAAHPEAFAADVDMTRERGVSAWEEQITSCAEDQSGVIVAAYADEQLVGMTGVGRGHWPKTKHGAIVWGVYVSPAWRGLHITGAMLDECVEWSRANGVITLKLGVTTTNQAAIHSYQRAGFTIYGTEPMSALVEGIYYDEYLMARLV